MVDTFLETVERRCGGCGGNGDGGGDGDASTTTAATSPLPCSIIALGAGFETTFFRLAAAAAGGGRGRLPTRYVELDFQAVTARKAAALAAVPELAQAAAAGCGGDGGQATTDPAAGCATGPVYALRPVDLRDAGAVIETLTSVGIDPNLPTLVLAECVLAYLPPAAGAALVSALGAWLRPEAACAVYDPIRPGDAFGRQMAANLEARGCPLVGVTGAPSPEAQVERFVRGGAWQRAAAADLREVWSSRTPPAAAARADALERLDELEEWHLILEHYGLAVGVNGSLLSGFGLPPRVVAAAEEGGPRRVVG
jgi:tRNA wybutosine-synthesizing protein 4